MMEEKRNPSPTRRQHARNFHSAIADDIELITLDCHQRMRDIMDAPEGAAVDRQSAMLDDTMFSYMLFDVDLSPAAFVGIRSLTVNVSIGITNVADAEDEDGNVRRAFNIAVTTRCSACTLKNHDEVHQWTSFMNKVACFVERLTAVYGNCTYDVLVRTAAEETMRKAELTRRENEAKVKMRAEYLVKGLRKGGNARDVSRSIFDGIPDGRYEVTYRLGRYNHKKYIVNVGYRTWVRCAD